MSRANLLRTVMLESTTARATVLLCCALAASACVQTSSQPAPDPVTAETGTTDASANRAQDLLMTWNLQWFQDPDHGPTDDAFQYAAVRDILQARQPALVALQEVASEAAFERLLGELEGYAGVLSGYAWAQKTALLYQHAAFELRFARALSGLEDAGRPPLEVSLHDNRNRRDLRVLVIHAKADTRPASYAERLRFGRGLKARLEAAPVGAAIVMGDFNDLLVGSLVDGEESPYRDWVDDPDYAKPTQFLNRANVRETSYAWGATVDHIMMTGALGQALIPRSVDVLRDELLEAYPDYIAAVSDHFPVVLRLAR